MNDKLAQPLFRRTGMNKLFNPPTTDIGIGQMMRARPLFRRFNDPVKAHTYGPVTNNPAGIGSKDYTRALGQSQNYIDQTKKLTGATPPPLRDGSIYPSPVPARPPWSSLFAETGQSGMVEKGVRGSSSRALNSMQELVQGSAHRQTNDPLSLYQDMGLPGRLAAVARGQAAGTMGQPATQRQLALTQFARRPGLGSGTALALQHKKLLGLGLLGGGAAAIEAHDRLSKGRPSSQPLPRRPRHPADLPDAGDPAEDIIEPPDDPGPMKTSSTMMFELPESLTKLAAARSQLRKMAYDPGECCPHCAAVHERSEDGNCNSCGRPHPMDGASKSAEDAYDEGAKKSEPETPDKPGVTGKIEEEAEGKEPELQTCPACGGAMTYDVTKPEALCDKCHHTREKGAGDLPPFRQRSWAEKLKALKERQTVPGELPIKAAFEGPVNSAQAFTLNDSALPAQDTFGRDRSGQAADYIATQRRDQMRSQLYGNALKFGLGAAGLGMAWRGIQGLSGLKRRKTRKPGESVVALPEKSAVDLTLTPGMIPPPVPDLKTEGGNWKYTMQGFGAKNPSQLPEGIPIGAGAALGGLALGYKGVDWLMRKRRKAELDNQVTQQKKRYEGAMSKISGHLDRLYDLLSTEEGQEKAAAIIGLRTEFPLAELRDQFLKQAAEVPGGVLGGLVSHGSAGQAMGTGALLGTAMAIPLHQTAYEYFKSRQPSEVLRKAKKELARRQFEQQPVVPVGFAGPGVNNSLTNVDDLEKEAAIDAVSTDPSMRLGGTPGGAAGPSLAPSPSASPLSLTGTGTSFKPPASTAPLSAGHLKAPAMQGPGQPMDFSPPALAKGAVDFQFHKRTSPPIHSLIDRTVFGEDELAPPTKKDQDRLQFIADSMSAAAPQQLGSAAIFAGAVPTQNVLKQIHKNQHRDSLPSKVMANRDLAAMQYSMMTPQFFEHIPASYHPTANSVFLNERSPGAMIHELGHGVDLQHEGRFGRFGRDVRNAVKPLLLKELHGWRKGRKAYQTGFAASDKVDDPEARQEYAENMRSYNQRKYPAFGTYVGGGLGSLAGAVGGGLLGHMAGGATGDPGARSLATQLGAGLGGFVGGLGGLFGGAHLGKAWANYRQDANEQKAMKQLDSVKDSPEVEAARKAWARILQERKKKQK